MLVGALPPGGLCLEIGVGTGRIAIPLAQAGVKLVGVDLSREMLGRLRAKGDAVPVVQGDATRLPFRDGAFDAAIAAHVLHLIPKWRAAIDELRRVVRPGRVILASRGAHENDTWDRNVRRRFFIEAGDPPWPPGIDTIDALDVHMRGIGVRVQPLPELSAQNVASINDLLEGLEAGYWSACWSIDEATRRHAAERTREWAISELGDVDLKRPLVDTTVWHAYET